MNLKKWLCSSLLAAVAIAPAVVYAGTNDAADAKNSASATTATTANASGPAAAASPNASPNLTPGVGNANVTALLGVLVMKGVLAPAEANAIRNAAPEAEFQLLVEALSRKGLLNAADLSAANPAAQPSAPAEAPVPAAVAENTSSSHTSPEAEPSPQASAAAEAPKPAPPAVVAAISPVRPLPIDPPAKDGLVPAFKAGGVKITPYGFIKATAAHDTSSPNGDDFPFVGLFLSSTSLTNTGPTQDPEFHLKARSTRLGANFEWPDASPRLTFTGRVEGDYEGNFSEVDNRDVTSIRSNAFQLRLAYVRMDVAATDKTDLFFEGGQDWAIFSSSVLPNILETTFLGAYYGTIYDRSPQMRFGLVHKFGGSRNFKISPEIAMMMPSTGQIEKLGSLGLAGQIGQAEREGADSGRPELEARMVFQFQLDKAPSVASAQIIWAGFQSRRTSIVTSDAMGEGPLAYQAAFPNGFTTSSTQYGNQLAVQLPTRWATLVASAYFGGDLRFFLGGQVNTFYTDTSGLTNVAAYTSVDGGPLVAAGAPTLATNGSGQVVVAPQRPIRAFGGFFNLGLPLSRWFNADPKGHNAGWQLYFHMGKDQVVHGDLFAPSGSNVCGAGCPNAAANVLAPLPLLMGKVFAATLYYKVNPYCTFGIEQSVYGTRLIPGATYTIAGSPDNLWQDHRTEFGPIFTF
jgi:hypothetical protein